VLFAAAVLSAVLFAAAPSLDHVSRSCGNPHLSAASTLLRVRSVLRLSRRNRRSVEHSTNRLPVAVIE
jgi:hypothetical protein